MKGCRGVLMRSSGEEDICLHFASIPDLIPLTKNERAKE